MNTLSDNEDTFIRNLSPQPDRYFIQDWANKSPDSSTTYQPDWCASVKFWKTKLNIIVAEAKTKTKQNRGMISDLVKLGKELKLMLEKLIYSGVNNPGAYGLLVKGGVLQTYVMDLKVDGVYRFIEIDTVNLVTNFTEIIDLIRTLSMVKRLELVELQKSKGVTVKPALPVSWLRGSTDPKMKRFLQVFGSTYKKLVISSVIK